MTMLRLLLPTALLCLPLIACGGPTPTTSNSPGKAVADATSGVGRTVKEAMEKAHTEIINGNISVTATGQPGAAITPDGRLLINGKEVTTTEAQHRLLKDYRGHVESVALSGLEIGKAGATLGVNAAGDALKSIINGDTDGLEARVNAQAGDIERQAKRLCSRMPAMLASQQALAAALPAFKPYATMDQSDVDDCGKNNGKGYTVNL
ncbi:MAG: hypothetical protein GAK31_01134 [Stenotrophomonas maltophilia]|uniref:DUF2884 family protein n=1 Tax=Stenotrophomonas maltophilia TaxID=40324 RepID=A0A7V8JLZ4_STEMA|nr:MAG: hypothetical protein GAK31_01134 [Stenotrophomonas maltophilia]